MAKEILLHVMAGLARTHEAGLIHRDVSPDNILISSHGPVKLIDFGAARQAIGEKSQNLTMVLKPGYAPEEQYRSKGVQGPWTDVYATAATMYRCITGQVPPPAPDRMADDELVPPGRLCRDLSPSVEAAILQGLAVRAAQRPQTIKEFQLPFTDLDSTIEIGPFPYPDDNVVDTINKKRGKVVKTAKYVALGLLSILTIAIAGEILREWISSRAESYIGPISLVDQQACTPPDFNVSFGPAISSKTAKEVVLGSTFSRKYDSRLMFSPDGHNLAFGEDDFELTVCDFAKGEAFRKFKIADRAMDSVAFGPYGQQIAAIDEPTKLRVWDVSTGTRREVIEGGMNLLSIAYGPDARYLAAGSGDARIRIYEIATGRKMHAFDLNTAYGAINSIAYSSDGERLVLLCNNFKGLIYGGKSIVVLNPLNGSVEGTLTDNGATFYSVTFAPNGHTQLAAATSFGTILWDGTSSKSHKLDNNPDLAVAYSPDGSLIATAGLDKLVRLWDARTGQLMQSLTGHRGPVDSLAFSPDGRSLASGGGGNGDKTILLWHVKQVPKS